MPKKSKNILLTPNQMAKADRLATKFGITSLELMENAGRAIVEIIEKNYSPCNVAIFCGPGNNGGDGFVVARLLSEKGWQVELALLGEKSRLKGDAKINAERFKGDILAFENIDLSNKRLIVDAIFGAGLNRDIDGQAKKIVQKINQSKIDVISVDVPSGIDGANGAIRGIAVRAKHTISFFRAKPGHYLLPARQYCGQLHIKNIGINDKVLEQIEDNCRLNNPELWQMPKREIMSHKYDYGHCLIMSGDELHSGAARLAARAALRIGAGLVSLAGKKEALLVHANHVSAIMLKEISNVTDLSNLLRDKRYNALIIGPAFGVGERTREFVLAALESEINMVIDADAISSFEENSQILFAAIAKRKNKNIILTPHEGEFKRLFPNFDGTKIDRAKKGAKLSGAIIVLKGADTIIALPNGFVAINNNAPPNLATAGSGDVLCGIIGGLLAQKMPAQQAACAGVYLHGLAAQKFGKSGLIADDLPDLLIKCLD